MAECERFRRRTVGGKLSQPFFGFFNGGDMAGGYPPQHEIRALVTLKPVRPSAQQFAMIGAACCATTQLWAPEDVAAPKVIDSKRFVSWAMTRWSKMAPLHHWLVNELQ